MKYKNLFARIFWIMAFTVSCNVIYAQRLAVKTNTLLLGNFTPNLTFSIIGTEKTSIELTGFHSVGKTPLKTDLTGFQVEMRYWFSGRPLNRFFIGGALTALRYDTSLIGDFRRIGDAVSPGLTYGYALPLGRHWNIEFAAGVGAFWNRERRYAKNDPEFNKKPYNEHGFQVMPNKLAVSCAYIF